MHSGGAAQPANLLAPPDSVSAREAIEGERNGRMSSIFDMIAGRHTKDVFVSECKTGPTWFATHLKLDAWAMKRSWAKPKVTGYEVKRSRSDFLRDDKWQGYLDYCNELYFVCPAEIIRPEEVGEHAGLLWQSKTGSRLYIKKKAPYRDVEIPTEIYKYILMSRAKIERYRPGADGSADYWRQWIEEREIDRQFGRRVSRAIGERVEAEIIKVQDENERLVKLLAEYASLKAFLEQQGINPSSRYAVSDARYKLAQLQKAVPDSLVWATNHLVQNLKTFQSELQQIEDEGTIK